MGTLISNTPVQTGTFRQAGVDQNVQAREQPQNNPRVVVASTDGFSSAPIPQRRLPDTNGVNPALVLPGSSRGVQLVTNGGRANQPALTSGDVDAAMRSFSAPSKKMAQEAGLTRSGQDAFAATTVGLGAYMHVAGKSVTPLQLAQEALQRPGLSAEDRAKIRIHIAENANNPEFNRPIGSGPQATAQDLRAVRLSASDMRLVRQAVAAQRAQEEQQIGAPTEINDQPQARRPQSDDNRVDPTNITLGGLSKAGLARRADAEAEKLAIRRDQRSAQSQEIVTDRRQIVQRTEIGGGATDATGGAVTRTAV